MKQAPAQRGYDVVVVGQGPGGSTAATWLARRGLRVLAVDSKGFPRYHIGESLTGTMGSYLRRLGLAGAMQRHRFPVKHGVTVMGRAARHEFFVAAAPEPTWQVKRSEFDALLHDVALRSGAEACTATAAGVLAEGRRVVGVRLREPGGATRDIRARYLVDAAGQSTWLARQGIAGSRVAEAYASQVAVFTQLRGCRRDPGVMQGNTVIFYSEPHHWAWFIPLDDELVSIGVVVTLATYRRLHAEARAAGARVAEHVLRFGLEHINPDLRERCAGREQVEPLHIARDYCYRVEPFAGDGWLCIGDAHRFLDPIFSFGVSLAVHEGERAAAAIAEALADGDGTVPIADYQRWSSRGQDAIADLIRYFWRFPAFFGVQARGVHRDDIMRLFAGAAYDEDPLPALAMMRESLQRAPA